MLNAQIENCSSAHTVEWVDYDVFTVEYLITVELINYSYTNVAESHKQY